MNDNFTINWRVRHPETAQRNFELLSGPAGNATLDLIEHCMDIYALHCRKRQNDEPSWRTATALAMMWKDGYIKGKQEERARNKTRQAKREGAGTTWKNR